jgi:DNA-directed RNA polymerase specialized sigma24 family protein
MTMPRTREELEMAAAEANAWLDSLDPATTPAEDTADLRRIGQALRNVAGAESELADAVAAARLHGRSWGDIALVLGTSRQAARQRFREPAQAKAT